MTVGDLISSLERIKIHNVSVMSYSMFMVVQSTLVKHMRDFFPLYRRLVKIFTGDASDS